MPITRRISLRKLRTAFSSSSTTTSPSRSNRADSADSNTSTSPLSTTSSTISPSTNFSYPRSKNTPNAGFGGFSFSNASTTALVAPEESRRVIRRKKSCVELEQEAEIEEFDRALVGMIEPRPRVGAALGGIEEVLSGEV